MKICYNFQVKEVYLQFMLHCYVDTDAEMKDVYNVDFIEAILNNIVIDIQKVKNTYLSTTNTLRCSRNIIVLSSLFIGFEEHNEEGHF